MLAGNPDLRLSTKAGCFTPDLATAARGAGVLTPAEAASGHCLTHRYVAWQSRRNTAELGRTPDVVFVHNPERATRPHDAIASAFTALEVAEVGSGSGATGRRHYSQWGIWCHALPALVRALLRL